MKATELANKVKGIMGTKTNVEAAQALAALKERISAPLPPPVGVVVVCHQKKSRQYYPTFIGVDSRPDVALPQLELLRGVLRHLIEEVITKQIDAMKELALREKLAAEAEKAGV